jgi:hypothetical protein
MSPVEPASGQFEKLVVTAEYRMIPLAAVPPSPAAVVLVGSYMS